MHQCKNKDYDCLKGIGKETSTTIQIEEFDTLILNSMFYVYLKNDTCNKVEFSAGKNIINEISIERNNNVISLDDKNSCKWFRNAKNNPTITIHYTDLKHIILNRYCEIYSIDTLRNYIFSLETYARACKIDLCLDINKLILRTHMVSGDIKLKGECYRIYLYNFGSSKCDLYELNNQRVHIVHNSSGLSKIKAKTYLNIEEVKTSKIYLKAPTELYNSLDPETKSNIVFEGDWE